MGARVNSKARLRAIPAVEKVLQALGPIELPRAVIVAAVRRELAAQRTRKETASFETIIAGIRATLEQLRASRIQPVINGTGIVIHTNLGRAPLSPRATEALQTIAAHYNNLEYDLSSGERGRRGRYVENNLALLCGAEAATVVNNCAAALILILRYFTARKAEVIISRGELIQIGGGFRIPDILQTSGATLREVGTTNKTTLADYAGAIGPQTGLILKVHRSNFFMSGFVEWPTTAEIAALARRKRITLVEDLGSGAVLRGDATEALAGEPIPRESLKAGAQLICFSGDKLFGGPQAGIIAGNGRLVAALKREPFFRALRCDKLILAALQTTSELHLQNPSGGKMDETIPVHTMLQMSEEELRVRAEKIVVKLHRLPLAARVGKGQSQLGGGSSPQAILPSVTVELIPANESLAAFAARLRSARPPVVGYVAGGKFKLDLRTIFARQDDEVVRAVTSACLDSAS